MTKWAKDIIIYRIEMPDGEGLYSASNRCSCLSEMYNKHAHPDPSQDAVLAGIHIYSDVFFGFSNISQLKNWVYSPRWRKELREAGAKVKVYHAMLGFHSNHQAVFIKKSSRLLGVMEIPV